MKYIEIEDAIKKAVATNLETLGLPSKSIEVICPPKAELGDFAVPCIELGLEGEKPKKQGPQKASEPQVKTERRTLKSGPQLASELAKNCSESAELQSFFSQISASGPYLNFKLHDHVMLELVSNSVDPANWKSLVEPARTMVEFLSPNTNKPLHLGHLRNAALGDSVSKILAATGQTVIKANMINDRGIHICKSMIAWQIWGSGQTPKSTGQKGDHFVGHYYVLFEKGLKEEREQWYKDHDLDRSTLSSEDRDKNDQVFEGESKLLAQARLMLIDWEAGKPEIIDLWQKMNQWVMNGFDRSLSRLGISFDKVYFESETYKLGKDIIKKGLAKSIFERTQNGGIVFNLPEERFGVEKSGKKKFVMVLRADGTSMYITQDIGTAVMKVEDFNLDRSIYVVASEQDHHFQCLFAILHALGYPWADDCYHLSYGMVNLPEGRMKSREGTVVDADDLMEEMVQKTKEAFPDKTSDLVLAELDKRSAIIGLGAMKFFLLATPPKNPMKYDPTASISLTGMTAPYCQYAAVRAKSILEKASEKDIVLQESWTDIQENSLSNTERQLARKLLQIPERLHSSAVNLDPSILAHHVFEIAQAFNQFYNSSPILNQQGISRELLQARLALVKSAKQAITEGLGLLGIQTPDRM